MWLIFQKYPEALPAESITPYKLQELEMFFENKSYFVKGRKYIFCNFAPVK